MIQTSTELVQGKAKAKRVQINWLKTKVEEKENRVRDQQEEIATKLKDIEEKYHVKQEEELEGNKESRGDWN